MDELNKVLDKITLNIYLWENKDDNITCVYSNTEKKVFSSYLNNYNARTQTKYKHFLENKLKCEIEEQHIIICLEYISDNIFYECHYPKNQQ